MGHPRDGQIGSLGGRPGDVGGGRPGDVGGGRSRDVGGGRPGDVGGGRAGNVGGGRPRDVLGTNICRLGQSRRKSLVTGDDITKRKKNPASEELFANMNSHRQNIKLTIETKPN